MVIINPASERKNNMKEGRLLQSSPFVKSGIPQKQSENTEDVGILHIPEEVPMC